MLITDEPQAARITDPELLFEEARTRQRRRQNRRAAFLLAAVTLVAASIGIARLASGGGSVKSPRPAAAGAAASSTPSVIYEKVELVSNAPHFPAVRAVFGTWIASDGPRSWRETVAGRPSLEYGDTIARDPLMGPELGLYLYDGKTKRIYRTGAAFPPPGRPAGTPAQAFRRLLAAPGNHLVGTRAYLGHTVYVVRFSWPRLPRLPNSLPGTVPVPKEPVPPKMTTVYYFDAHSYVPVYFMVITDGPGGPTWSGERALAWKTLPATAANLKLANLATAHPGTKIVPERVARVSGSVYNTEPAPIPGLAANLMNVNALPLYWAEAYGWWSPSPFSPRYEPAYPIGNAFVSQSTSPPVRVARRTSAAPPTSLLVRRKMEGARIEPAPDFARAGEPRQSTSRRTRI